MRALLRGKGARPMSIGRIVVACKVCAADMVVRTNRENGSEFLGCSKWPECTETRPLPESIRMERLGAPRLL